jgi:4-aminobutyrate aminotransferase-like enzyme
MRFRPPLTITRDEIDFGVKVLRESLQEMKK